MSEHMQLSLALCRIGLYTCFRALCCKGPPPPRPEYDVVCIGLTGAGKTSLLSRLCGESTDNIVPTTGFSIKAVPFPNAILNVKELGGADNIKKYWSRYYQGSQGVIFVLDSASSDEDLESARNELHSALQHPQLCTLPFLILANHQDKPAARAPNQVNWADPVVAAGSSPMHNLYFVFCIYILPPTTYLKGRLHHAYLGSYSRVTSMLHFFCALWHKFSVVLMLNVFAQKNQLGLF
uniref:ADP-ribosylation factor-like protein 15 n=1 Tax=Poecilia reticulata TaxID=8081 RepID=A0A3P9NWU8_POERE